MKKHLKRILKFFFTSEELHIIRMKIKKKFTFKKDINTILNYESVGEVGTNSFFGYYDISPFSENDDEIVYLNLPKDSNVCNIMLYNLITKKKQTVDSTLAWNWQQGSRLRWFPTSNDEIIFNDFKNGKYISKKINIYKKTTEILDYALYDISNDGNFGLTLDFSRLGKLRPGYGYTNIKYIENEENTLFFDGIKVIDLNNNKEIKVISYKVIIEELKKKVNISKCYINHLSYSPNSEKFLFFFIEIIDKIHKASLVVYDISLEKIIVLEKELSVSHYDWIDNENIIITAYDKNRKCEYYIYNLQNKSSQKIDFLQGDGHPTWIGDNKFITDTYVDNKGYQKVMHIDLSKKTKIDLLEIYSSYKVYGEFRCDLHPRISNNKKTICIDGNIDGKRKIYFLKGIE